MTEIRIQSVPSPQIPPEEKVTVKIGYTISVILEDSTGYLYLAFNSK